MTVGVDLYHSDSIKAVQILDTAFSIAKHFTFIFQYLLLFIILLDKLIFPKRKLSYWVHWDKSLRTIVAKGINGQDNGGEKNDVVFGERGSG